MTEPDNTKTADTTPQPAQPADTKDSDKVTTP